MALTLALEPDAAPAPPFVNLSWLARAKLLLPALILLGLSLASKASILSSILGTVIPELPVSYNMFTNAFVTSWGPYFVLLYHTYGFWVYMAVAMPVLASGKLCWFAIGRSGYRELTGEPRWRRKLRRLTGRARDCCGRFVWRHLPAEWSYEAVKIVLIYQDIQAWLRQRLATWSHYRFVNWIITQKEFVLVTLIFFTSLCPLLTYGLPSWALCTGAGKEGCRPTSVVLAVTSGTACFLLILPSILAR